MGTAILAVLLIPALYLFWRYVNYLHAGSQTAVKRLSDRVASVESRLAVVEVKPVPLKAKDVEKPKRRLTWTEVKEIAENQEPTQ